MNSTIYQNLLRFLGLVVFQGLVFKNIGENWDGFPYLHIFIYPVFLLLLPINIPSPLTLALGFLLGISVDFFYNTLGVHASASVCSAFLRPYVLRFLEPRNGYNINYSPTIARVGAGWFVRYASLLLTIHLFFYFSVEAFTFVYIADILLKTLVSFVISLVFVLIYQLIFNPLE
jgi:hypothetical protein